MEYKCPRCGKLSVWKGNKYRPFCSERCKLIDLGEWADEKFKVETDFDEIDDINTNINDD
ncbi:MAG: DNA gyrase inhibitor YacG [Thermodesulfobacteriota bacterium]